MKKVLIAICALMCANAVMAQSDFNPPTKEINWFGEGKEYADEEDAQRRTGLRSSERNAPIAPATLLLLGLGGATVGAAVIRNSKKGGE